MRTITSLLVVEEEEEKGEMERATDTVWFVRIPVSSPQAAWNSAVWTCHHNGCNSRAIVQDNGSKGGPVPRPNLM